MGPDNVRVARVDGEGHVLEWVDPRTLGLEVRLERTSDQVGRILAGEGKPPPCQEVSLAGNRGEWREVHDMLCSSYPHAFGAEGWRPSARPGHHEHLVRPAPRDRSFDEVLREAYTAGFNDADTTGDFSFRRWREAFGHD